MHIWVCCGECGGVLTASTTTTGRNKMSALTQCDGLVLFGTSDQLRESGVEVPTSDWTRQWLFHPNFILAPPPPSQDRVQSGEWQVWRLLRNSLWHPHPQGTLNNQSAGATPTGKAGALHFLPWTTSDTPSLCLVALKRWRWGFLPSQTAGCNWCGRDVSTNLLLSDGLSVKPLIHWTPSGAPTSANCYLLN